MVNTFWFAVLAGCVMGFLSGLGVGGGSLLLLWLTLVLDFPQDQARLMNLMFFLPCAAIACLFRWKQGKLNWKISLTAVLAGLAGAWLGVYLTAILDPSVVRKGFGILLLLCGIREIRYRPRNAR